MVSPIFFPSSYCRGLLARYFSIRIAPTNQFDAQGPLLLALIFDSGLVLEGQESVTLSLDYPFLSAPAFQRLSTFSSHIREDLLQARGPTTLFDRFLTRHLPSLAPFPKDD